jgi:hypothetical protein
MTSSGLVRPAVITSVLVLVVLAGCSSTRSTTVTTTTVTTTTVTTVAPGPKPLDDLRQTVYDRFPTAFVEEPAGSDLDGPLDLAETAKAVDDQETAKQEAILRQYGFRSAYQRTWVVKGAGEVLVIRVQLMGSAAQALGYFQVLNFDDRLSAQLTRFATPQLADASGFTRLFTEASRRQVSQDVSLVRGRLFYHLIFTGPRGAVSPGDILRIARSQSTEAASLGFA